jgi:hypothetical protein
MLVIEQAESDTEFHFVKNLLSDVIYVQCKSIEKKRKDSLPVEQTVMLFLSLHMCMG